jgi:hypothetical protein
MATFQSNTAQSGNIQIGKLSYEQGLCKGRLCVYLVLYYTYRITGLFSDLQKYRLFLYKSGDVILA